MQLHSTSLSGNMSISCYSSTAVWAVHQQAYIELLLLLLLLCWRDVCVCAADFPSAPNLTAAAAAQNLEWAPVTVQDLSLESYSLSQDASSSTILLSMTATAKLGVAGSITDVATPGSSSGRRSLLSSGTSGYQHVCAFEWPHRWCCLEHIAQEASAAICGGDE